MRLAVLGDPVEHSLSPIIHAAALRALSIDGTYEKRRVDSAGMRTAVDDLRIGVLDGANVTMPHKALAAELCDHLGATAARAGVVNTLSRSGRTIVGDNTDVAGIVTAWEWAGLPTDGPVVVLGAGGAAAAAVLALERRDLTVIARRAERAVALADRLGVAVRVARWGSGIPGAVVVNATPIGMRGEPLPDTTLEAASGLFEMAYGQGPTPAARLIESRGLPVSHGPEMLLAQASVSFSIWTGRPAPLAEMRAALAARAPVESSETVLEGRTD